jgi:hypothetical protein
MKRRYVLALTCVLQSAQTRLKPIYTDTNMCDPSLREEIERSVEDIRKLRDISPQLPADWELALELGKDGETGEPICSYYFVRLSTRCLFWLHDFDLDSVLAEVCGVTEMSHIRESAPLSSTRRTKSMTRPGTASSVLVGDHS